ncbi:MAG: PDZ domain-containing protein [Bacteroidia bacterium]|nr:PDZ domain-containing protein [Bacteroidia bacterium]
MKNYSLFLLITLLFCQTFAQDTLKSVTIRIKGDVNGKEIKIDTTLTIQSANDVNIILNELGLNGSAETQSLDKTIIIREKSTGSDENSDLKWFSTEGFSDSMFIGKGDVRLFFSPDSGDRFVFAPGDKMGKDMNFNFNWDSDTDWDSDSDAESDSDRSRAFMGISMSNDESGGVRVTGVTRDSGAEKAGLRSGDIIVMIEKERIGNDKQLSAIIRSYDPGDKVEITFIRGGKKMKATVKLGKRD